jgi:cytochrome oxidase assembly protein ShyY1
MTEIERVLLFITLAVIGYGLFWYATSFMAAAGLYVVIFANNLEQALDNDRK